MCCQPHLRKTFCGEFMDLFVLNVVSLLNKGKQLTVPPLYTLYLDFKKLHRKGGGTFFAILFQNFINYNGWINANNFEHYTNRFQEWKRLYMAILYCITMYPYTYLCNCNYYFFLFIFGALRFLFEFLWLYTPSLVL